MTELLPLKVYSFALRQLEGCSVNWVNVVYIYNILKVMLPITKTCLYKFDPLKPYLYMVKLGFTGVYIFFYISAQNIDRGYSLETPRRGRGGFNEYPQSMFLCRNMKILEFLSENFQFLEVKLCIYLNRRVFVMIYFFHVLVEIPSLK